MKKYGRERIGKDIRWKKEIECASISVLTHVQPMWQKKDYKGNKF